jgi:FSR family fosmidomycin resistance protein-like MFS transporter
MPLRFSLLLLLPLGIALNGTSTVLYGSVAELAPDSRRAHAFAVFYTATLGGGAVAPSLYGQIADRIGLPMTILCVAGLALLTLPLACSLQPFRAGAKQ